MASSGASPEAAWVFCSDSQDDVSVWLFAQCQHNEADAVGSRLCQHLSLLEVSVTRGVRGGSECEFMGIQYRQERTVCQGHDRYVILCGQA